MSNLPQSNLYQNIREVLQNAKRKAAAAVNFSMVEAYWLIGKMIVEEEQGGENYAVYGSKLIPNLSEELTKEFGKGFHTSNLAYMRKFFLNFENFHALRGNLSWTHYRLLLKVQNEKARQFYMDEAAAEQWSTRTLERQINSFYFERLLSSQDKKPVLQEADDNKTLARPEDILKDPYVLEFLQLKEHQSLREKELESALLDKLQDFLLELGKGFTFVARQKRITADGEHFYIDLVFYNYWLKCFVLIDLKIGKLTHQDIGQIDFYTRYWEDNFKPEGDNPTLGIVLCSEKNETIVKYSLLEGSQQIFASKYLLYLPSEEVLSQELNREIELIRQTQLLNKFSEEEE